jgi:intracellular sulfur oxidation DsrE/DsrF family protein
MKILLTTLFCVMMLANLQAQQRLNPVIQGFGSLTDVPAARVRADSTIEYKIVVEFRSPNEHMKEMHQSFEHIGRMYNLHIYDKVPQKKLQVVVVIFGPAVSAVLNNEAYKSKFKTENPNLKVFEEFKKAGIKVVVCGQSLALHGIDPATVASNVDVASSRFTTVSTCQMKGFALFQMD